MTRPFRGATYRIEIVRDPSTAGKDPVVLLDGVRLASPILPLPEAGRTHEVKVRTASHPYASPVRPDHVGVKKGALLERPFLRREVDVDEAEPVGEPRALLEVVHE
jgi:hypothetical protein